MSKHEAAILSDIHGSVICLLVGVEKIPVTDGALRPVWGNELIRLVFKSGKIPSKVEYIIKISN